MWTISTRLASALKQGTRYKIKAIPGRTFTGDTGTIEFVVFDGSVTQDRNQQLGWSGSLVVSNRLADGRNAFSYADPRGGRTIWVQVQILFPDNSTEIIKFPPMLVSTLRPVGGTLQLTLIDQAQFHLDCTIPHGGDSSPGSPGTPASWINYITNLRSFSFSFTWPLPTVVDTTGLPATFSPNPVVPDSRKPLAAADAIADAFGISYGIWRDATFLVSKRKVAGVDASSWTFESGATGVILEPVDYTIRREDYATGIVAYNPDDPTVVAIADGFGENPAVTLDFGDKGRYFGSPILDTNAKAAAAAITISEKAVEDRWTMVIRSIPVFHLDAGDVIKVQLDGVGIVDRVISRIVHPLSVGGVTEIQTDAPALPDESVA